MIWTHIGERVERLRKERNLSKAQFGRMLGLSGQYVGMLERGQQGLSVESVVKICQSTGASADYILFGRISPSNDAETVAALTGLNHEQIQIALDIINKVAQFIRTEDGNEALIREVMNQQRLLANSSEEALYNKNFTEASLCDDESSCK